MWTSENRGQYDRKGLRYPTDLTDAEWALVEPHIRPAKRGGRPRTTNVREVMNAIPYLLGAGCQWRALPKAFAPRTTVFEYLDLWEGGCTTPCLLRRANRPADKPARRRRSSTVKASKARKKEVEA